MTFLFHGAVVDTRGKYVGAIIGAFLLAVLMEVQYKISPFPLRYVLKTNREFRHNVSSSLHSWKDKEIKDNKEVFDGNFRNLPPPFNLPHTLPGAARLPGRFPATQASAQWKKRVNDSKIVRVLALRILHADQLLEHDFGHDFGSLHAPCYSYWPYDRVFHFWFVYGGGGCQPRD